MPAVSIASRRCLCTKGHACRRDRKPCCDAIAMKPRDVLELIALAAIWGAAFLFIRTGVPEFGVLPLVGLRVIGATLVLLPLLAWRGETAALRKHWKAMFVV